MTDENIAKIQVLGSGCSSCKRLLELTRQAVAELGITDGVEYVTDIQKIIEMGVMQTPVLAVGGRVVIAGFVPNLEKVKEAIQSARS